MNKLYKLLGIVRQWFRSPFFGFVQGHAYLTQCELDQIEKCVGKPENDVVSEFESRFASIVGDGRAVSFAAGRMGFYALMKILGIGSGDEVVIQGATCSVMIDAVLRTGAEPVYSDIDRDTLGSSALHIERCITPRTRMIVAQHSFGIPCDIEPIVALSRSRGIFLLEDCALTLGSRIDGVVVGNFGDAAMFSTDHSKPLNTLTGGFIYTRDVALANKLSDAQAAASDLPVIKQKALWKRFLLECRYCNPAKSGCIEAINLIGIVRSKLFKCVQPFLSENDCSVSCSSYPYPARMPGFLAAVGLHEVKRWPQVVEDRKELLRGLLEVAENSVVGSYALKAYVDKRLDIVPLRFVWTQPDGASVRDVLSKFIYVSWTWFLQPIVGTSAPLERFRYQIGACPISEYIGLGMVNLPCNLSQRDSRQLIRLFREVVLMPVLNFTQG